MTATPDPEMLDQPSGSPEPWSASDEALLRQALTDWAFIGRVLALGLKLLFGLIVLFLVVGLFGWILVEVRARQAEASFDKVLRYLEDNPDAFGRD